MINANSKFEFTVGVTGGWNLSGWTARMQIRPVKGSPTLYEDMATTGTNPELSIVVPASQVLVDIPSNVTHDYAWTDGVYDLILYENGDALKGRKILEGQVRVNGYVTEEL